MGEKMDRAFGVMNRARLLLEQGKVELTLRLLESALKGRNAPAPFLVDAVRIALIHERYGLARRWVQREIKNSRTGRAGKNELLLELKLLLLRITFSEEGHARIAGHVNRAFRGVRRWNPWLF